jgi:CRP/FNR family transcriptional regulator
MTTRLARPTRLDRRNASDPCANCGARLVSVCNAIGDADLARLATIAAETEAGASSTRESRPVPSSTSQPAAPSYSKCCRMGGARSPGSLVPGVSSVSRSLTPMRSVPRRSSRCATAGSTVASCALLDDFPLMEKRLLKVAANELMAAQEQMLLLGRKTARERLASFLLSQSRQGLLCGHMRGRFTLPMTRNDIADYLGLTIETVGRTLTRLRNEGLIEIAVQSEVVVDNPRGLEGLAGGLPARI